jgi:hypothetical protein
MGAFFTNVHVRAPAGEESATRTLILEIVSRLVAAKGLVACAEGEKPDRSIVVGPAGAWIGVFDEDTESQDVKLLDALAKALSEATSCPALAALVHDSGHLLLRLFEGGKLVDQVDRTKKKGKPDRWSRLVAPDKADALSAAFAARDLFAEQTLREIAGPLGIDPESACAGHKYLVEEPLREGATCMRFRHAVPTGERFVEGPPHFQSVPAMITRSLAVGGALHLSYATHNHGGPVRNFYVAVHGRAVDAGLAEVDEVRVKGRAARATRDRGGPRRADPPSRRHDPRKNRRAGGRGASARPRRRVREACAVLPGRADTMQSRPQRVHTGQLEVRAGLPHPRPVHAAPPVVHALPAERGRRWRLGRAGAPRARRSRGARVDMRRRARG